MASRFMAMFRRSLEKRPVITNTAVYATFYTAAEISQQSYNKYYSADKHTIDYASAARTVCVGSSVYAPALYYWYRYLDRTFTGKAVKAVATKVAVDQFFMTPILLSAFFTAFGIIERREDVFGELRQKFWTTFVANQAFWIPAQSINFYFMPPQMRVVFVASASFLWINVLCFIKRQKTEEQPVKKTSE